jgi:hypothetical protein
MGYAYSSEGDRPFRPKVITGSSDRDHADHGRQARHDGGAASPILALQLLFSSDVSALGGGVMGLSPE